MEKQKKRKNKLKWNKYIEQKKSLSFSFLSTLKEKNKKKTRKKPNPLRILLTVRCTHKTVDYHHFPDQREN